MESTPKKKGKGRPMGQRYTHTWSIRLSEKQAELVRQMAEMEDCEQVDVIRDAIEELARKKGLKE